MWDRLLRVAYGSEIEATELFLQHTYLVIVAKAVATAAFVDHLPASGQDLLDGKEFRDLGIVGAVEADFFDWLLKAPEGDELVLRIARQAARFDLSAMAAEKIRRDRHSPGRSHFRAGDLVVGGCANSCARPARTLCPPGLSW